MLSKLLLPLLCIFLCTGCGALWNQVNQSSLRNDVQKLLQHAKLGPENLLEAKMQGETRNFVATVSINADQLNALVKAFDLEKSDDFSQVKLHGFSAADSEIMKKFADQQNDSVVMYTSKTNRPAELREHVTNLEFLIIFFDPQSNRAVLLSGYSYG